MAKIEDLLSEIADPRLRQEISREVSVLKKQKKFGLVFEEHIPETVQIPGLPVRPGVNVAKRDAGNKEIFLVEEVLENGKARIRRDNGNAVVETANVKDLVVVKRFGDPIYPTLVPVDKVTRAEGKPYHALINADNFHALQLLLYCYTGQVDVIYIDPPYNTGARDWKYNNDYVDNNDQWRHSKWLSFMKKRLAIARRLLKQDGVLICTIDDHEINNLGVLLNEMFPGDGIYTVVIEHNKRGRPQNNFAISHEYACYVVSHDRSVVVSQDAPRDVRSINIRRTGNNSSRQSRPSMFYPIYVDPRKGKIVKIGDVPANDFHPKQKAIIKGELIVLWPLDDKGEEKCWYYGKEGLENILKTQPDKIQVKVTDGNVRVAFASDNEGQATYRTVWNDSKYDSSMHGSVMVKSILGYEFPFPKSLYAVHECITTICKNRPDALILDFFAGSGTTLHATALLNSEDGGNRRCILVTNNEVNEKQAKGLNEKGIYPGDPKFEKYGICESVTWPRCKYVMRGYRDDKTPLPGTYLNGREMKLGFEENMEFFNLEFLDPHEVAYGDKFEAILPILWLMAGAKGEQETAKGYSKWFIPKSSPYAVLIKEDAFGEFKREIKKRSDIAFVFLVTDSEEAFREMAAELPRKLQTKMLYKSYLDNFRINTEKSL